MSNPLLHSELTEQVIGAAYEVYNELGFGFLETVYEKSLVIALRDRGIDATAQKPIDVWFRGEVVGNYVADLVVGDSVLVELKSVRALIESHEVQLVNYLVATGTPVGLLINFGPDNVEVRRKVKRLPA
jgi:GxxExxY protein